MFVFPLEKQWFSRFDTFISSCFFNEPLTFFRHRFLYGIFMILEAILARCSMPFQPFGHHFSILFRCRFFHDFRMPFWSTFGFNIGNEQQSGTSLSHKKICFFMASFWALIFDGFWRFLRGFWGQKYSLFLVIYVKLPILLGISILYSLFLTV